MICSIQQYKDLSKKRETVYNKNGFITKFNPENIWDGSYYLHKVDSLGKRVYVYHNTQTSLSVNRMIYNIEKENGNKKFRNMSFKEKRKFISSELNLNEQELTETL